MITNDAIMKVQINDLFGDSPDIHKQSYVIIYAEV